MSTAVNVNDPTKELTSKPWQPMSPEQLDALRPRKATRNQTESPEAFAYRCGISALSTVIYRLQLLEEQVAFLFAELNELRQTHDRNMHAIDARHKKV